ncbi:MAG TPA: acyltransferase [Drouetiella sp.]
MADVFNPIFMVATYAVALLCALAIVKLVPYYRTATAPDGGRFRALDGLRGFLAMGVFIHHVSINYVCEHTHEWKAPASSLYHFLGDGCVALFFMITGFLFWSKALKNPASVAYSNLMKGRILRLMPMYLATYVFILAMIGIATHFTLRQPLDSVLYSIGLGACGGLFGMPPVNNFECGSLNCGVVWSLFYEWRYYLLLPVMAFLWRGPVRLGILTCLFLGLALTQSYDWLPHVGNFIAGMAAAQLMRIYPKHDGFSSTVFGVTSLSLMACVASSYAHLPYMLVTLGILPFFVSVVYGFSGAGLFTSRASVLLGTATYSIYLAHGIVLHFYMWGLKHVFPIAEMPALTYWLFAMPLAGLVVATSAATFYFIERPFIELSHKKKQLNPQEYQQAQEVQQSQEILQTQAALQTQEDLQTKGVPLTEEAPPSAVPV